MPTKTGQKRPEVSASRTNPVGGGGRLSLNRGTGSKVGIPNFVSGPREYIMEGEYVILAMCSWFSIS